MQGDVAAALNLSVLRVNRIWNMNKVFVLVTQWSVDYEQGVKCEAYATKELAQEAMKQDYEYMCDEYPDWVGSIGDDCAELQEEGDYTRNHCDWQIKGLDVISE